MTPESATSTDATGPSRAAIDDALRAVRASGSPRWLATPLADVAVRVEPGLTAAAHRIYAAAGRPSSSSSHSRSQPRASGTSPSRAASQ